LANEGGNGPPPTTLTTPVVDSLSAGRSERAVHVLHSEVPRRCGEAAQARRPEVGAEEAIVFGQLGRRQRLQEYPVVIVDDAVEVPTHAFLLLQRHRHGDPHVDGIIVAEDLDEDLGGELDADDVLNAFNCAGGIDELSFGAVPVPTESAPK